LIVYYIKVNLYILCLTFNLC